MAKHKRPRKKRLTKRQEANARYDREVKALGKRRRNTGLRDE